MLARACRLILLTMLLAYGGWCVACVAYGNPMWVALPIAAGLGVHALLLATEFALLRRVARSKSADVPTLPKLLLAWWGELLTAPRIFCWQQPFRSARWPDSATGPGHADRRGVLLVHGYICNRGLWNDWLERLQAQGLPFQAVSLEPVFGSIDDYAAVIERAVGELHAATGRAPVVVAHSMGGLAVRSWWAAAALRSDPAAGASRIHCLITLGTPHRGTWLAGLGFTSNARQMRQGSAWLADLTRREPPLHRERSICFYSPCDNIVFPCEAATLDGADNRRLDAVAHVAMIDRAEPFLELQRRLLDASPALETRQ